jgi:hypothetical protein
MLTGYERISDRVGIEVSLPVFLWGIVIGFFIGLPIIPIYLRNERFRRVIEATTHFLLLTILGLIIGWLAVDPFETARTTGMVRGGLVGAPIGLLAAFLNGRK